MRRKLFVYLLTVVAVSLIFTIPVTADDIKLKIPKFEEEGGTDSKGQRVRVLMAAKDEEGNNEYIEEGLQEFIDKFKVDRYKVTQVELWVEGMVESGSLTKFVISMQGSGGMRIILRPKKQ
jgi:hypothetical protein